VVTSVNRLVAARPYPAVHVEAPDPDIIMRRPATSERTMTTATAEIFQRKPTDPIPSRQSYAPAALARLHNPDQFRRGERYRFAGSGPKGA
jgi:hypothetical protein